jgi:hypothetical protein
MRLSIWYIHALQSATVSDFPTTKFLLTINIFTDNELVPPPRTPKRPPALGQFDFNAAKKWRGIPFKRGPVVSK